MPLVKAIEYPATIHTTVIAAQRLNDCIMIASTFFFCTIPA